MENITYLLGAGASFHSLPIVSQFPDEIKGIIKRVEQIKVLAERDFARGINASTERVSVTYVNLVDEMIQDLTFLLSGCVRHASVDTFARSFYLTNNEVDYLRVKNCIILFFELYSFFYPDRIDKRYDFFLSKILNRASPKFPTNINILSWNYDYEFEKAYEMYSSAGINSCYDEINGLHKYGKTREFANDYCKVVKLNGTIGYFNEEEEITLGLGFTGIKGHGKRAEVNAFNEVVNKYFYNKERYKPSISFSWEDADESIIENVKEILLETNILVVIGYSFPDFNRKIDKMILSFQNSEIDKIIIQDVDFYRIQDEIKKFREYFEWENTEIIEDSNLHKFLVPHEFENF